MWNQYGDDTVEWDAANDQLPTQEQRKTLVAFNSPPTSH